MGMSGAEVRDILSMIDECRSRGVARLKVTNCEGTLEFDLYPQRVDGPGDTKGEPPDLSPPSGDPLEDPATSGYNLVGFARTAGAQPHQGEEE